MPTRFVVRTIALFAALLLPANFALSVQNPFRTFPEQRELSVRAPETLPSVPVPPIGVPFTVSIETENRTPEPISLDEAIFVAVRNADVIRVLTGISATNSGSTIYDVAISNTAIDEQNSVFDPNLRLDSVWANTEGGLIPSSRDNITTSIGVSKRMTNGADVALNANLVNSYFEPDFGIPNPPPFPLPPQRTPEYQSFAELALTQPLMKGYGRDVNLAPIVVARIDTERSYFRFKDSVQELVRGVIAAYWNLVSARVDVWARQQQVEQAEFAFKRASARQDKGLSQIADVAQARSALATFRAGLITARADLILRETALRNILGVDPSNTSFFLPTSVPVLEQVEFNWNEIVAIAEQYRPDVIELKLILEADRQNLLVADNQARPQLDGVANYRWDGLRGELSPGVVVPIQAGRFQGFNLGVNFSVPLGLRRDRASLRRQELVISRDQANLEQGIFQMVQQLTINYRNLDQFFAQYLAFKEARSAARQNYENQAAEVLMGRREFINALQAITDWGNSVSQEARSITQYNTELANVERQTGTILETHGIYFVEERYSSLGPRLFGLLRSDECYPERLDLNGTQDRYKESENSSDESFNLENLQPRRPSDRENREPGTVPDASVPEVPTPKIDIPQPPTPDIDTGSLRSNTRNPRPQANSLPTGLPRLKAMIGPQKVTRKPSRLGNLFR